jgi:two-component system response regulator AtoC
MQAMMAFSRRILVIDEDPGFRRAVHVALQGLGYTVIEASTGRAGLAELAHSVPDCILADERLSDLGVEDLLRALAAEPEPRPPVVVVGGGFEVDRAVELMRLGAKDVVTKPIAHERLRGAVTSAIERSELARDLSRVQSNLGDRSSVYLVAESHVMQSVLDRVERLAPVEMPVVLVGERGTGRGTIARRLHAAGPRAQKAFVVVPQLDTPQAVEHALFGTAGRASAFAQAQDGVVFIESITSLGREAQERLSRVLQDIGTARTGGQPVNAPRLVVGAERPLDTLVEAGLVHPELARRLSPLSIQVPSLDERRADVPVMARLIVERACRERGRLPLQLAPEVIDRFTTRAWPGNVRELESVVLRAVAVARGARIGVEDLPEAAVAPSEVGGRDAKGRAWSPTREGGAEVLRYDDYEAEIFRFALDKAGGCVSRAAELLGVGRATMYRKMRSYDIDAPPVSERAIVRTARRPKQDDPLGRAA